MYRLVFLLVICGRLSGQENDSLLPKILSVKNDTERVNQLYKRGFVLRNTNPQTSFEYGKRCEEQALLTHSQRHIAKSYNLLGVLYYKKGDYKRALNYHQKALQLRLDCNDVLGIAFSQTNLGNVYSDLQLYSRAENAYLQAMNAYRQLNNTEKVIGSLINIGAIKQKLKQYNLAIENFSLALAMTETNDYDTRAICLTNLATAYVGKNLTDKAIALNQDAIKLRELSDNNLEVADNYLNLGGIYIVKAEYDKAKYYLDTAYYIAGLYDYFKVRLEARKFYAIYYNETKNFQLAYDWLRRADNLRDTMMAQIAEEKQLSDFNDQALPEEMAAPHAGIPNVWLIVCIVVSIILVPLFLIRFKR